NREATFATVDDLAEAFNTSSTATAIRLVQAGSFPAMVVCSENGDRKWFVRGPDVPESLWPRETPTPYTVAADLLKGKPCKTPNEIRADGWLSHRGSHGYYVIEDSRRVGRDSILTLVWWKDESQLVDITEEEESRY
ncbi:MAG: hypothetical protein ACRD2R_04085, partial [Terriglobales bacterium]